MIPESWGAETSLTSTLVITSSQQAGPNSFAGFMSVLIIHVPAVRVLSPDDDTEMNWSCGSVTMALPLLLPPEVLLLGVMQNAEEEPGARAAEQ